MGRIELKLYDNLSLKCCRAGRVALAVIWKGASQPLDIYGPRHRAFISG